MSDPLHGACMEGGMMMLYSKDSPKADVPNQQHDEERTRHVEGRYSSYRLLVVGMRLVQLCTCSDVTNMYLLSSLSPQIFKVRRYGR